MQSSLLETMELLQTGFKSCQLNFLCLSAVFFKTNKIESPDHRTSNVIIQTQTVFALYNFPYFHSFHGITLQG